MDLPKSKDMTNDREHPILKRLRGVASNLGSQLVFQPENVNGIEWLRASVLKSQGASQESFWVPISSYQIYCKPLGVVTFEDVRALRNNWSRALLRPVVVVASRDGFDKNALMSIKRSKWLDYFDEHHLPTGWTSR